MRKPARIPRRVSRLLLGGDAGVRQTVNAMRRLIRRDANDALILKRARQLRRNTDIATVETTLSYVIENFHYLPDPADEELFTAPRFFENGFQSSGDCDDLSGLLACLLLANEYRVGLKTIAWRPENRKDGDPYTHVYVVCMIPSLSGYIPLDPVMSRQERSKKGYDGFGGEKAPVFRKQVFWI